MEDNRSRFGTTLLSAGAFFVQAAALDAATWWLYTTISTTCDSLDDSSGRLNARASRASVGMVLRVILTGIGAIFFAAVGAYTFWLGVT